jgi:hypothetical protein
MSSTRSNADEADASRRKIFIIVGLVTALLVAGLVWWMLRPGGGAGAGGPQLEGALRADSAEFARVKDRVVVDYVVDDETLDSISAVGGRTITAMPTVRNFTGRTIDGLELKATVVDLQGQPVRERALVVIPNAAVGRAELEPNKFVKVNIPVEGLKKEDVAANVRVEVTAVRFKP